MNETPVRVRVKYSKSGDLRFIGHIDTQKLFERALRRTDLPLRFTQGFNKRIRINLASALPLGFVSSAELLDFWLNQYVDPYLISGQLNNALPKDIRVLEVQLVENSLPSLQASLVSSEYLIDFPTEFNWDSFKIKFNALLAQESILIERRKKTIDLKPMILDYSYEHEGQDKQQFFVNLSSSPTANARPDHLLQLLDVDPADCLITRIKLNFA